MTFFEEIKGITEKVLKEKAEARIEVSKAIIQEANKGIREKAESGCHVYILSCNKKDCDLSYIQKYYQDEGFIITYNSRSEYVISW